MYIGIFYIQAFSIFMLVTLYKYFSEERDKKMIRGAFQHYLNPAVISTLIENPSLLKLGGEKKTLTVFFSDVRGFTTISESLSPEKLTSVLNEYFTPMTKVVLDSNGLLDKYIGDAIMAVWGAPITLLDHADRALDASLEMLEILKILQAKWKADGLPHLDIGIGINTGEMVVGNMGSDQRFDYTVLGDSVNLGSRLEGITKNYGIRLICSQFTKESVLNPDKYIFRELDFIRVKGKNEPIKIYEVMEQNPETKNLMKSVAKEFEEGLAFYKKGDWDNAFAKFQKVLELRPEDGPAKVFVSRCEYLKTAELDHPWDGIWTYKTK